MDVQFAGIGVHQFQAQQGADVIRDVPAEFVVLLRFLSGLLYGIGGVFILTLPGDNLTGVQFQADNRFFGAVADDIFGRGIVDQVADGLYYCTFADIIGTAV